MEISTDPKQRKAVQILASDFRLPQICIEGEEGAPATPSPSNIPSPHDNMLFVFQCLAQGCIHIFGDTQSHIFTDLVLTLVKHSTCTAPAWPSAFKNSRF